LNRERLDKILCLQGFFTSREKAAAAVMAGCVQIKNEFVFKPGKKYPVSSVLSVKDSCPYVSRGGYKLAQAINDFKIIPEGKICLDIGASTGGFTDCLLQNKANLVYTVDCGTNQLAYSLRNNNRVICRENYNARFIHAQDFSPLISLIVIDVSFISFLKILEPLAAEFLYNNPDLIILIKPEFEAEKSMLCRGGVVKNIDDHKKIMERILKILDSFNFNLKNFTFSNITGAKSGNIEYLAYIKLLKESDNITLESCFSVVEKAFIFHQKT